jgi:endo-1,4-beta-D-glucanase Y
MAKKVWIIRIVAIALLLAAGGVAAYAYLASSNKVDQNIIFASHTLLAGTWESYKEEYWEDETGRTLDKQQNNITTSEGQSYTMLRAVWMSDKPTFDRSWAWTQEQLQREDKLFSWRWGQRADGTYGVLTDVNGQNAASDADTDIAFALLMAAGRWQQQEYIDAARTVIDAIWEHEVVTVNGVPYVASNNLEKQSSQPIIMNPSYLAPYAYREFARVDSEHDWSAVVDSSYAFLDRVTASSLDTDGGSLVPDWVMMDRQTGEVSAPTTPGLTTQYGYDAMRTPWRLALDYQWNGDERAKTVLSRLGSLKASWEASGVIYSTYSHKGEIVVRDEVAEAYGTALAYFMVVEPQLAEQVFDEKIAQLYDQNKDGWAQPLTYYASNWVWFGIALYEDQLPNLAAELRKD